MQRSPAPAVASGCSVEVDPSRRPKDAQPRGRSAGVDGLHELRSAWFVFETVWIFAALALAGWYARDGCVWLRVALALGSGAWLYRLYFLGHEAVHRKLWPRRPWVESVIGQLALAPLLLPLAIYRKIHQFHHARNRETHTISALDTFIVDAGPGQRRARRRAFLSWYLAVFCGGFFIHGLVSVVLFLFLPLRVARRVSPAFAGWRGRDRAVAISQFTAMVALQIAVGWWFGARAWWIVLGAPLLAFAWIYSLLVYVFHYGTSYGRPTRKNARSLDAHVVVSWWLMNFNEHEVHHADPTLPWYALGACSKSPGGDRLPLWRAVLGQLAGPTVIVRAAPESAQGAERGGGQRGRPRTRSEIVESM